MAAKKDTAAAPAAGVGAEEILQPAADRAVSAPKLGGQRRTGGPQGRSPRFSSSRYC